MKAGVSCYCFNLLLREGKVTLMDVIQFIGSRTEAEYVELLSRFWIPDSDEREQAREAKRLIDRLGLKVSCYTLDSDFSVYDEEKYRGCIDLCKRRLETAQILGTDTIRLDPRTTLGGKSPDEVDPDEILVRIAQGMAEVADAAAERGIKVGVENHGRLLGRSDQIERIVKTVNRPNFGVNLDFTNFRQVFGEDHLEATRKLAEYTIHVHAKDFLISREPREGWIQIPTGEYIRPTTGGKGDARWREVFQTLKEAGYDGVISLEVVDREDIEGSVIEGVANIRRIIDGIEGRQ